MPQGKGTYGSKVGRPSKAAKAKGKLGQRARFAKTLSRLRKK